MERTEREEASIDFAALVNAAIEAKRAEEVKRLLQEEQERGGRAGVESTRLY